MSVAGVGRLAAPLLGRHVQRRAADRGPLPGLDRDPEVGQLAVARAVDEHVLRLVVAVHDAELVRGGQAEQRALQHDEGRLRAGGTLPGDHLVQRDAVDELHHDRRALARGFDVVEQPHHVRHVDRREQLDFLAEAVEEARVAQQPRREVLDRHLLAGVVAGRRDNPGRRAPAELTVFGIAGYHPCAHVIAP